MLLFCHLVHDPEVQVIDREVWRYTTYTAVLERHPLIFGLDLSMLVSRLE